MTTPAAAAALIRSKSYLALLVIAAIIGVPISALAYFFLSLVSCSARRRRSSPSAAGSQP